MNKPIIAIQKDHQLLTSGRYQSFSARWHELAAQQGITTRAIDIFSNATDGVAHSRILLLVVIERTPFFS